MASYGSQVVSNVRENGFSSEAFTDIDIGAVGRATAVGAVAGATGGLGSGVLGVTSSSILSGGAARATDSLLSGRPVTEGLADPRAVLADMALGGLSSVAGGAAQRAVRDRGAITIDLRTAGRTADEAADIAAYARRVNDYARRHGPMEVVGTRGALRGQASRAAAEERERALLAGRPYQGQAGHVPDTALTGQADPPAGWLDVRGCSNQVCGGVLGSRIGRRVRGFTANGARPRRSLSEILGLLR